MLVTPTSNHMPGKDLKLEVMLSGAEHGKFQFQPAVLHTIAY